MGLKMELQQLVSRSEAIQRAQATRVSLLVLLCTLMIASQGLAMTVSAQDTTAGEALSEKETAEALLDDLRSLNDTDEVSVDSQVIQNIGRQLNEGQIHFERAEYTSAQEAWSTATEQARATLKQAYIDRSRLLLAASAEHLENREEAGLVDAERADLVTRQEELNATLQEVDSLAEARQVHSEAEALHTEVSDLPEPWAISVGVFLEEYWFAPPIFFVAFAWGVFALGRRMGADTEVNVTETTDEGDSPDDVTSTSLDASEYRSGDND